MAIEVKKGQMQSSMGRRLFAAAAPLIGGAFGGPAGAAAGQILGSKMGGATAQEALGQGISGLAGSAISGGLSSSNPAARALSVKQSDPEAMLNEGLTILGTLPKDDPLKRELAPAFIQAEMVAKAKRRGY